MADTLRADLERHIKIDEAERFWSKVNKTETCWLWTGALTGRGYGHFWLNGHMVQAHRFAYGDISPDLQLDHLCRVRTCVRPRSPGAGDEPRELAALAAPLVGENVRVLGSGERKCLTCRREEQRSGYARHAEARRAYAQERRDRIALEANHV